MNFKEQVKRDIGSVFLNLDEFAEQHCVEGKTITAVVDELGFAARGRGAKTAYGLAEVDMTLFAKAEDLPDGLEPGNLLSVDGREHLIVSAHTHMGLTEVALRQNVTG